MYVREKKIRRGMGTWDDPLKVYSYWQLVRNSRVDGKVRQKVVAHLGRLPHRLAANVVARSRGLVCGVMDCGERGVVERTGVIERRGREVERPLLLCGDHAERLRAGKILTVVHLGTVEELQRGA